MIRTCPMCHIAKDIEPKGYCPPCHAKYVRDWYQKNKDSVRDTQFKYKYGITLLEYTELLESQNGKCAICKSIYDHPRFKYLAVDHCHSTGKVRGLLCHSCNAGLGRFKDDPAILYMAMKYLEAHE